MKKVIIIGADRAQAIEKAFNSTIRSKQIHEAVLFVENFKGDFSMNFGYGGRNIDSPFLMASITKLFTTACILILQEQKKLSLDHYVEDYFDETTLSGLHIYKGKDYSRKLILSDLLFQTSGLPDWFEEGGVKMLTVQKDFSITFEEMLANIKALNPHFAPPSSKKAYYSDINFDLLGEIIEKVAQMPLEEAYRKLIYNPLGLKNTYLPISSNDFVPNIYYKNESLHRPNLIMCCRASGGGISTARELMLFLKAFFNGSLFPLSIFQKLSVYRKLQKTMGPIYYGGGYMQIPMSTANTLFMGKGELLGHTGTTGSFAFYYPNKDLYIVGDLNQMANPSRPIRLAMKLAMTVK